MSRKVLTQILILCITLSASVSVNHYSGDAYRSLSASYFTIRERREGNSISASDELHTKELKLAEVEKQGRLVGINERLNVIHASFSPTRSELRLAPALEPNAVERIHKVLEKAIRVEKLNESARAQVIKLFGLEAGAPTKKVVSAKGLVLNHDLIKDGAFALVLKQFAEAFGDQFTIVVLMTDETDQTTIRFINKNLPFEKRIRLAENPEQAKAILKGVEFVRVIGIEENEAEAELLRRQFEANQLKLVKKGEVKSFINALLGEKAETLAKEFREAAEIAQSV